MAGEKWEENKGGLQQEMNFGALKFQMGPEKWIDEDDFTSGHGPCWDLPWPWELREWAGLKPLRPDLSRELPRDLICWLLLFEATWQSLARPEHVVLLPQGAIGLSTRGKALRVRVASSRQLTEIDADEPREVLPAEADATFRIFNGEEEGIEVDGVGAVSVFRPGSRFPQLRLRDSQGRLLMQSEAPSRCGQLLGRRAQGGHVLLQKPLDSGACCEACQADASCTDWSISKGSCVLLQDAEGWTPEEGAVAGRSQGLLIFNSSTERLYGRGAGPPDALQLLAEGSPVSLANRATYVPYFYSRDGYAALGHSNVTHFNRMAARYHSTGQQLAWAFEGAFQLYLMPAASLSQGTKAYYALTGRPALPPRHILGFMACRWGWKDQRYLEETLDQFRNGGFPLDSVILDFEWFANTSDYSFRDSGESWYDDFGWNPQLFSAPSQQLKKYLEDQKLPIRCFYVAARWAEVDGYLESEGLEFGGKDSSFDFDTVDVARDFEPGEPQFLAEQEVHVAGIRKPRLGNRKLLHLAKEKGWLSLSEGAGDHPLTGGPEDYAHGRWLRFSEPELRRWYAQQMRHYLDSGISYWWNDEGENFYYTYHDWNLAELELHQSHQDRAMSRFFSLNRAFTPGMARLGAAVWTGDVTSSWEDLRKTPGMMLNWALAGAPYVACDIGGFSGNASSQLLARWYQARNGPQRNLLW
eukprot:s1932_g2.t2